MITRFSNWLIRQAIGLNILILIALLVAFQQFLFPYLITHFGSGTEHPILDTLFGFSPDQAHFLLFKYGEAGRQGYITTLLAGDILFPFVYGGLLALINSWLLKMNGLGGSSLQKLNLLPLAAMLFDLLENAGILSMLRAFPEQSNALAGYTSLMGMAKWVLLIICILLVIGLAIFGLIAFLKRK